MRYLLIAVLLFPLQSLAQESELWNGWYVGGAVGKQKTDVDPFWSEQALQWIQDELDNGRDVKITDSYDETVNATLFRIGYNWNHEQWVSGIEFNYFIDGAENFDQTVNSFYFSVSPVPRDVHIQDNYKYGIKPLWAIIGKLGYLVQPELFVYGLGGFTAIEVSGLTFEARGETTEHISGDVYTYEYGTAGATSSTPYLTLGVGLEYYMASSWSVNAEYRMIELNEKLMSGVPHDFGDGNINDLQSFTIGLNYHF